MTITMAQTVTMLHLTKEELRAELREEMIDFINALGKRQCLPCNEPKPEIKLFYTREETRKLLSVSLSTLQNWKKEGVLVPVKGKGRVLYSKESIDNFLKMSA